LGNTPRNLMQSNTIKGDLRTAKKNLFFSNYLSKEHASFSTIIFF
jgi:hypothetical protein